MNKVNEIKIKLILLKLILLNRLDCKIGIKNQHIIANLLENGPNPNVK